ncbi:MAG: hypothetical protein LQ352_000990 [Teloschistes flavicans]|nr:MAG: hypothetical protein LQ352_000990 [Teloschistes flavicans]
MEIGSLTNLLEDLDDAIDELEQNLRPLTMRALTEEASKLPLLDKAQLYILVTYAIESILFSYLRLNGIDPKEHPIATEIARVRQYFEKLKNVESIGSDRENLSLNKVAAGRVITHALVCTFLSGGNQQRDHQNKTQRAPELGRAQAAQNRNETSATGSSQLAEDEERPSESRKKRKISIADTSINSNRSPDKGKLSSLTTHLQHDEVLDRAAKERKRRKRNGDRPQSVSKRGVDPD